MAKIAKDKCTHRSTNPFDASISTVARLLLLCGYTPLPLYLNAVGTNIYLPSPRTPASKSSFYYTTSIITTLVSIMDIFYSIQFTFLRPSKAIENRRKAQWVLAYTKSIARKELGVSTGHKEAAIHLSVGMLFIMYDTLCNRT